MNNHYTLNNHYAKFEYKGMITVAVTDYTNQTPPKHFLMEKCLNSTPLKNIHEMCTKYGGARLQSVKNNYAKFELLGMKNFGVTDYTN